MSMGRRLAVGLFTAALFSLAGICAAHAQEEASSPAPYDVVFSFDVSASLAPKYIKPTAHERMRDYLEKLVTAGWDETLLDPKDSVVAKPVDNTLASPLLMETSRWSVYHFGNQVVQKMPPRTGAFDRAMLEMSYPATFKDQETQIPEMLASVCVAASEACGAGRRQLWVYVSDDIPDMGAVGTRGEKVRTLLAQRYYWQPVLSVRLDGGGTSYKGGASELFLQVFRVVDIKCEEARTSSPADLTGRITEMEGFMERFRELFPDATPEELELLRAIIEESQKVLAATLSLKETEGAAPPETVAAARTRYDDSKGKAQEFEGRVRGADGLSRAAIPLSMLKILLDSLAENLRRLESLVSAPPVEQEDLGPVEKLLAALSSLRDGSRTASETARAAGASDTRPLTEEMERLKGSADSIRGMLTPGGSGGEQTRAKLAEADALFGEIEGLLQATEDITALHGEITAVSEQLSTLAAQGKALERDCKTETLEAFRRSAAEAGQAIEDVHGRAAAPGMDCPGVQQALSAMKGQAAEVKATLDALAGGCPCGRRCMILRILAVVAGIALLALLFCKVSGRCGSPPPPPPSPVDYHFERVDENGVRLDNDIIPPLSLSDGDLVRLSAEGDWNDNRFDLGAARGARVVRRGDALELVCDVTADEGEPQEEGRTLEFDRPEPVENSDGGTVWLRVSLNQGDSEADYLAQFEAEDTTWEEPHETDPDRETF